MLLAARSTSLVTWPQTPCSLERLHSACARNLRESAEVELRNRRAGRHSRIDSALTIRSSRDRFAASADHGNMLFCQGRKSVRLNSGVSAAQRFLAQQSGSRFAVTSGQIADPTSLAALPFSSSAKINSAVLRSALMALSGLVLRGGANNSFKPTPLRGAA